MLNARQFKEEIFWSSLEEVYHLANGPWCIGGDFNVILSPDEKLGPNPHRMNESLDFNNCMNKCEVTDIGSVGPNFTSCNEQKTREMNLERA